MQQKVFLSGFQWRVFMVRLISLIAAGAVVGQTYWYFGCFGLAFSATVLIWRDPLFREKLNFRSAAFLIITTVILEATTQYLGHDLFMPDEKFFCIVACMTLAVAGIHALFLKAAWKRAIIAAPGIFATWYLIIELLFHSGNIGPPGFEKIFTALMLVFNPLYFFWMTAYLFWMFLPAPRWRRKAI